MTRAYLVALVVATLLAAPAALAESSKARVANQGPSVASISGPATVTPTAGGDTTVEVTLAARDPNGHADVARVTVEVLKPDGTVHRAAQAATAESGSGKERTFSYSFQMAYYDAPANASEGYKVVVTAEDSQGQSATHAADLYTFAYQELAAVALGTSAVDFGADLPPGNASDVLALPVRNHGNVRIDVTLAGTALAHATEDASIPASAASYSTSSDMTGSAALGTSAATLGSFDLAHGAASSRDLYWRMGVPSGASQWVPAGTYTGTLTVGAVAG